MRILIDIGHPGHVHFYKHAIRQLRNCGHEVLVTARDKDVTLALLEHYDIPYYTLSSIGNGSWGLLKEFIQREWELLKFIRKNNPDIVTAIGGLFIAPVCKLLGKPSIVFTDSEPVPLDRFLTYPISSLICTPDCFMKDLGKNHVRYAGYHELAYLHPDYFQPDPTIVDDLDVSLDEPYIILRFVAWKASHDLGQQGFSHQMKKVIVERLSQYGQVFITSEDPLPEDLKPYQIQVPPHRMHDVLYYASLFVGDGATMATEAGLLGTPAIRASTLALDMGNFIELMEKYHLVYSYYRLDEALDKAIQLMDHRLDAKEQWARRREIFFDDMIDVTKFVIDTVFHYGDKQNI